MSGRIVKLHAEDWHWTCGDGCCDDWGTDIFIDGKKLDLGHSVGVEDVENVLKAVGAEYELSTKDLRYDNRVYGEDD